MTETTVDAHTLETLDVLTELGVHAVGQDLVVLAVDAVLLSVQEPRGDLVLSRVLEDLDDTLQFFNGDITSAVKNRIMLAFRLQLNYWIE